MSEPFVLVAGLPSGGTSMMAGVLHTLGVCMIPRGAHVSAPGRWYKTFEDPFFFRSVLDRTHPYGKHPKASTENALAALSSYVEGRRRAPGPQGLKAWWQWASVNSRFEQWRAENNVRVVYVRRPLAETAQSYFGYETKAGRGMGKDEQDTFLEYLYSLNRYNLQLEPDLHVDYADLRAWDRAHFAAFAHRLGEACGFTPANVDQAFAFVKPENPR